MSDASFEKVSNTDRPLYGPRKLLLCGFTPDAQNKFEKLTEILGLDPVDRVWVSEDRSGMLLAELMALAADTGKGSPSNLPRLIVVGGISEKDLHALMGGCRKAGMQRCLWAVLTPTSRQWSLSRLIEELTAEREALNRRGKR